MIYTRFEPVSSCAHVTWALKHWKGFPWYYIEIPNMYIITNALTSSSVFRVFYCITLWFWFDTSSFRVDLLRCTSKSTFKITCFTCLIWFDGLENGISWKPCPIKGSWGHSPELAVQCSKLLHLLKNSWILTANSKCRNQLLDTGMSVG